MTFSVVMLVKIHLTLIFEMSMHSLYGYRFIRNFIKLTIAFLRRSFSTFLTIHLRVMHILCVEHRVLSAECWAPSALYILYDCKRGFPFNGHALGWYSMPKPKFTKVNLKYRTEAAVSVLTFGTFKLICVFVCYIEEGSKIEHSFSWQRVMTHKRNQSFYSAILMLSVPTVSACYIVHNILEVMSLFFDIQLKNSKKTLTFFSIFQSKITLFSILIDSSSNWINILKLLTLFALRFYLNSKKIYK